MELDAENVKKLCKLARIQCTDAEIAALLKDLKNILSYVDQLQELDTEHVKPCNHVLAMNNVLREDEVVEEKVISRDTFLKNSPAHVGGMVRVPPVIRKKSKEG